MENCLTRKPLLQLFKNNLGVLCYRLKTQYLNCDSICRPSSVRAVVESKTVLDRQEQINLFWHFCLDKEMR